MSAKYYVLSAFCLVFTSTAAFAEDTPGGKGNSDGGKAREMMRRAAADGRPGFPGPGGGMAMMPVIAALDTDKDGTISATEIANASKALLTLDKNGDGVLSTEEFRPAMPSMAAGGAVRPGEAGGGQGAQMMMRMFETRDANGDGKLSGDELPEQLASRLSMVDENGDGAVDKSEFERVAARMAGGKGGDRPTPDGKDGSGRRPKRPGQE